jgi:hypothetical protein
MNKNALATLAGIRCFANAAISDVVSHRQNIGFTVL